MTRLLPVVMRGDLELVFYMLAGLLLMGMGFYVIGIVIGTLW